MAAFQSALFCQLPGFQLYHFVNGWLFLRTEMDNPLLNFAQSKVQSISTERYQEHVIPMIYTFVKSLQSTKTAIAYSDAQDANASKKT